MYKGSENFIYQIYFIRLLSVSATLFNVISTFESYSIPKPSLSKSS